MRFLVLLFCFSIIGCKKKTEEAHIADHSTTAPPPYDTVAIDSFAPGATPAGVSAAFDTIRRVAKKDSLIPVSKEDLTKNQQEKKPEKESEKDKQKDKEKQKTASLKKKDSI